MISNVIEFGALPNGECGYAYEIKNSKGMTVRICNVAAAIVSVFVPDKNGNTEDVILGYRNAADYLSKGPYHGACIGRVANRIEDSVFTLNGKTYHLEPNHKEKHVLHGGLHGLDNHVFDIVALTGNSVTLETEMKDGEDGFPGNVSLSVTYTVTEDNALSIVYRATSDADTVLNLTNHAYFNLAGQGSGTMLNHELQIFADEYLPLNEIGMVYDEVLPVDSVMDFREAKAIGRDIGEDHPQLKIATGYDHNYILKLNENGLTHAAHVFEPESGRMMDVYTDMPGILLYSGNYLENHDVVGKDGRLYKMREGFCLETNYYPNALKYPQYPQPILRAGAEYKHETVYKFSA